MLVLVLVLVLGPGIRIRLPEYEYEYEYEHRVQTGIFKPFGVLELAQNRFHPHGLYLLDEPEVPLSAGRQLALLKIVYDLVERGNSQFIIATHSPILLAYPEARIYSFDGGEAKVVEYDALDHVTITRDFLNAPQRYLRHMLG